MRILLVEDTKLYGQAVKVSLKVELGLEVKWARTLAEAKTLVEQVEAPFDLALVDLILPDACDGEAIDFVTGIGLPAVIFSGVFSEKVREIVQKGAVIDYVVKESPTSLDYLVRLVAGLKRNRDFKALVVDDSKTMRRQLTHLLTMYGFDVCEAADGREAIEMMESQRDIRLILTDYNMPKLDGMEMTKKLRASFPAEQCVIIGLSSASDSSTSAKFIKYGANDFLVKPFQPEDLFFRIVKNLRMVDLIDELSNAVATDYLTKARSRSYFFEAGGQIFASWKRHQLDLTIAMLDLDHFKQINDVYGHDAGDLALKEVARALRAMTRETDIVARLGGEEFGLMLVNLREDDRDAFFEKIRAGIEELNVVYRGERLPITASIGVASERAETLEGMLDQADQMLYQAKEHGRNRVERKREITQQW